MTPSVGRNFARETLTRARVHGAWVTYAPSTYQDARKYLIAELDSHPGAAVADDLDPAEVGIAGSDAHKRTGTSYHLGADDLKMWLNPYSARLARDKAGLTNGAAALDVGWFRHTFGNGTTVTLRHLSTWLVAECQHGAVDTLWIREIGYSPDGKVVLHWDRERGQASAPKAGVFDNSHLTHTHVSGYRDREQADKTAVFRRYVAQFSGVAPGHPTTPPPAPPPVAWQVALAKSLPVLRLRDSNSFVRSAQALLVAYGYLDNSRASIDGWYGPKTKYAAERYQGAHGLTKDGEVGPGQTWPALLADAHQVQQGDKGVAVKIVQALLCSRGRWVAIDGDFGPRTAAAVRGFQGSVGLPVDGIPGQATIPRLVRG